MINNLVLKFVLYVTVASVFLTPVFSSFDFVDNEFDQELQSQIDDYADDDGNDVRESIRLKRATDEGNAIHDEYIKCKQQSRKSCCGSKSSIFKHFGDHNKTLGKACYEDVMQKLKSEATNYEQTPSLFSCEKYKLLKKVQYCVFECTGKKRGLLNANGDVNLEEMNKYLLSEVFTEKWQKDMAPKIMENCLQDSNNYPKWPVEEPGIRCNPIFVQFQYCLWREYEVNCPESEQKSSKKCTKLRNLMRSQTPIKKKI